MQTISILGATGSIGGSTLKVLSANPEKFAVVALTANKNVAALVKIARTTKAKLAVIGDETKYEELKNLLAGTGIKTAAGKTGLKEAAAQKADYIMAAITGIAGLPCVLEAAKQKTKLALANKESVVCSGKLLKQIIKTSKCQILPVDSEHHALSRILNPARNIKRVILTASGGAFRDYTAEQMNHITPALATTHPVWNMGKKISVDSATLMNKVLELIEAHILFDLPPESLDMLLHRQSIVHAMVEEVGGGIFAFMGAPDMRLAIADVLGLRHSGVCALNLANLGNLSFEPIDEKRFRAASLAQPVLRAGPAAAIILNAANESAVNSFLAGAIGFTAIAEIVADVLEQMTRSSFPPLENVAEIIALDELARRYTEERIKI